MLLMTAIIGILILAAISIFERIEKRRKLSEVETRKKLSEMETRIRAMNKKIDEFFWRQDENNM